MSNEEYIDKIISIAQLSGIKINNESNRLDMCEGWNSINLIMFIGECEKTFNVKFGVKAIVRIHTIEDILSIIMERRKNNE